MTVEARVDTEHDADFNSWYDSRHLPESVACPGYRAGARYRSSDDKARTYLTTYIIDDESTMDTPEIRAIRGFAHLTPFVQYERRLFRPLPAHAAKEDPGDLNFPPRPVLVYTRSQVAPERDDEFNYWYEKRHIPEVVACPGWRVGALYRSSDEKALTYLAIYIVDDESAMKTPELAAVRGFGDLTPYVRYDSRLYRPLSCYIKGSTGLVRF